MSAKYMLVTIAHRFTEPDDIKIAGGFMPWDFIDEPGDKIKAGKMLKTSSGPAFAFDFDGDGPPAIKPNARPYCWLFAKPNPSAG